MSLSWKKIEKFSIAIVLVGCNFVTCDKIPCTLSVLTGFLFDRMSREIFLCLKIGSGFNFGSNEGNLSPSWMYLLSTWSLQTSTAEDRIAWAWDNFPDKVLTTTWVRAHLGFFFRVSWKASKSWIMAAAVLRQFSARNINALTIPKLDQEMREGEMNIKPETSLASSNWKRRNNWSEKQAKQTQIDWKTVFKSFAVNKIPSP